MPAVVRYATRRANHRGLHNVRVAVKDAQTLLRSYIPAGSVSEIHLYHPQPYHDPKQMHLRLVTPRFLVKVHRALTRGGLFVVQTDNPDYWRYITTVAPAFFTFREHPNPWPDAPEGRSRREILARSRGLPIYRGIGKPIDSLRPGDLRNRARELPLPTFQTYGPWDELDALEAGKDPGPSPSRPRPKPRPRPRSKSGRRPGR